jgi:hypothetical protein
MTYVLGPDERREVRVLAAEGGWLRGWLEAFRHVEGTWLGFVHYTTAPGELLHGWFEESRIRDADLR